VYKNNNNIFMITNGLGRLGWGAVSDLTIETTYFPKGFYVFLCNVLFLGVYSFFYFYGFAFEARVNAFGTSPL